MSRKTNSYFDKALTHTNGELVELMRHETRGVEYDTIVGTGLSGTIFTARVAPALRKKFAIIRKKDDESTHSSNRIEGVVGQRFVVADDFVSSGATLKYVLTTMHKIYPKVRFVGLYQYEFGSYKNAETCVDDYGQWVADIALGGPLYGPKTYDQINSETWGNPVLRAPEAGWHPRVAHLAPLGSMDDLSLNYLSPTGEPTFWDRSSGTRITGTDRRVQGLSQWVKDTVLASGVYNAYVGMRMPTVLQAFRAADQAERVSIRPFISA